MECCAHEIGEQEDSPLRRSVFLFVRALKKTVARVGPGLGYSRFGWEALAAGFAASALRILLGLATHNKNRAFALFLYVAGPRGFEPLSMVLETIILPLNYRPVFFYSIFKLLFHS